MCKLFVNLLSSSSHTNKVIITKYALIISLNTVDY